MKQNFPPMVIARPIPKSERLTHTLIPRINIEVPPSEKALPPRIVSGLATAAPAASPQPPAMAATVEVASTKASQTSARESIVLALTEAIAVLEDSDTKVFRNLDKPITLPAGGLIILRDNESAKEVDVLLSPLTYTYELTVQIEIMIQHPDGNTRSQQLDLLISLVSNAIAINKTLSGLAEYVEMQPAEFQDEPVEGAATIRSAMLPVLIRFSSREGQT